MGGSLSINPPRVNKCRLFGGSAVCITALTLFLYQWHLPVFDAEGNIEAVSVHRGKYKRTDFLLRTPSGGDIALNASGSSPYFRRDEHVKVRYRGETGAIVRVLFVSAEGKEEGVFNSTGSWPLLLFLPVGLIIIFQGFRRYRRDPEGAEDPCVRDQHPYGAVDQRSLLGLSGRSTDEPAQDD